MLNGTTTRSPACSVSTRGADLAHDTHRLVADDVTGRHERRQRVVEVQVRAAQPGRGDLDDDVGRLLDDRVRDLDDLHVLPALPRHCLHACLTSMPGDPHALPARIPARCRPVRATTAGRRPCGPVGGVGRWSAQSFTHAPPHRWRNDQPFAPWRERLDAVTRGVFEHSAPRTRLRELNAAGRLHRAPSDDGRASPRSSSTPATSSSSPWSSVAADPHPAGRPTRRCASSTRRSYALGPGTVPRRHPAPRDRARSKRPRVRRRWPAGPGDGGRAGHPVQPELPSLHPRGRHSATPSTCSRRVPTRSAEQDVLHGQTIAAMCAASRWPARSNDEQLATALSPHGHRPGDGHGDGEVRPRRGCGVQRAATHSLAGQPQAARARCQVSRGPTPAEQRPDR